MHLPSVLVIEDNSVDRDLWTAALGELGQNQYVGFAKDGIEALAQIRKRIAVGSPFQLVISDYRMPHISGSELYENLGPDLRVNGTAFVMLSGTVDSTTMATADCPWYENPLCYADFKDLIFKFLRKFSAGFSPVRT